MKKLVLVLSIGLLMACSKDDDKTATSTTSEATITFTPVEGQSNSYKLSQLKANLSSHDINIYDVHHYSQKNYRAFVLKDVLDYGFGSYMDTASNKNLKFLLLALDPYTDTATYAQAIDNGGYLAYEDLDVNGSANWGSITDTAGVVYNPAPFYIVWSDTSRQTQDEHNYPWIFEFAEFKLIE